MGLVALLMLALALVAVATAQLHKRHIQQAHADEARRHVGWLTEISDPSERARAAAIVERQPSVLHAGAVPADLTDALPDPGQVKLASFQEQPAIWTRSAEDGEILVILSLSHAQASIDAGRHALFLYLGLTLVFVTLVGYAFFSLIIIRPLRALGIATQRAAQGDLASPIQVLPRNELGEVGRQFNAMLERLDDQRTSLQQKLEDLEQAHDELKRTQDSLIRSEKMAGVGQLAAGVAHEVGNPLAAVMGYTDLLRDRELDEETADDLAHRSITQLKRIRQTIRQLLDYSRAESDTQPTSLDAAMVIDEAVHLVRATPAAREVDIQVDLPDALPKVRAITGELSQILVNLLLNAVAAMNEADTSPALLVVSAEEDGQFVQLDVLDSGPGLDPEIATRIFDPFFTTRSPGAGTGLGLAITQRLVARIDGTIELVESTEGAHFRVRLPRAESPDD